MRPVYGRSPWIDRFPKSRVPAYQKFRGELDVDVVIIGGGLTGCATAYAFAAAGMKPVLLEADRIGRGTSGASAGWITAEPSAAFRQVDQALGRRAARYAWQAWRRAALDFTATIRRLQLKCAPEPRSSLLIAADAAASAQLAREQKARGEAGIDSTLVPARAVPAIAGFGAASAMRTRDDVAVDPYRLTVGMAAAAAARGAQLFERSPVTKTSFTRESATVAVGSSVIRTRRVIVATNGVHELFRPLARHLEPRVSYLVLTEPVPAKRRKTLGSRDHLIRDLADPPRRLSWVDDERLLICGADGEPVRDRARDAVLVQRTGQLMYELSTFYPDISGLPPAYGWDAAFFGTATGLPIIGPHRNYPFHLFAAGGGRADSLTGAYLASRILLRHHLDDVQASDAAFGFGR